MIKPRIRVLNSFVECGERLGHLRVVGKELTYSLDCCHVLVVLELPHKLLDFSKLRVCACSIRFTTSVE